MDEKTRELLELVFRKCVIISERSKTDVWFNYSPHANCYCIEYCLHGWKNSELINMDVVTTINYENLQKSSKELDNLWALIEENNLKTNCKNNSKE